MTMTILPTGSTALDEALGVGGFPCGRVIEMFGSDHAGMIDLLLHTIAAAQRAERVCAFIGHDQEVARAGEQGVNLNALIVAQPESLAQRLEIVETLVRTGTVDLIVVGTLPAPPAAAVGDDLAAQQAVEDEHFRQARRTSQQLRGLTALVSQTTCVVVFLSALPASDGLNTALKYYASVRLQVLRTGAQSARVKVVKNKVSPPFREAEVDLSVGGAA